MFSSSIARRILDLMAKADLAGSTAFDRSTSFPNSDGKNLCTETTILWLQRARTKTRSSTIFLTIIFPTDLDVSRLLDRGDDPVLIGQLLPPNRRYNHFDVPDCLLQSPLVVQVPLTQKNPNHNTEITITNTDRLKTHSRGRQSHRGHGSSRPWQPLPGSRALTPSRARKSGVPPSRQPRR